ncbi:MAG TPA: helix-turn-helix domain-containing protein [Candidatus Acidoferrales bacterium]|nr:helix-turn-helix domain-containing protein [Candidatus Acidoferrales bacterium]
MRRTRGALGDALVELMHEKPFRKITVQDVLDRAKVGRSTFYTHFRDKDDLFLSDAEEFFEMMATILEERGDKSNRILPVRELFAHISDMRAFYRAMAEAGKLQMAIQLGEAHFARGIDRRLAGMPEARSMTARRRSAVSHALAGALMSLLSWWIARGTEVSPEQMDDAYHHLVWFGVGTAALRPGATRNQGVFVRRLRIRPIK